MTSPRPTITAADRRRAAVLLTHAAGGDALGLQVAMFEDTSASGIAGLLAGLVDVILTIVPPLSTPEGVEHLRRIAAGYSLAENAEAGA